MKKWIKAFRLKTLPLSVAGLITGSAIAAINDSFKPLLFVFCILAAVSYQILSNLANDLGDFQKGTDNENRLGPKRALQSGEISEKSMKTAVILFSIMAFIFTALTAYIGTIGLNTNFLILFVILGIAAIGAAIKYTMGKSAYGYSGLGDIFVFLFFGWLSVLGGYFLQTHDFDSFIVLPASGIGLLSTAVLNMNNMRDHENDADSHKNTIIVKMGYKMGKYYHAILIFGAIILLSQYSLQSELPFALFANLIPFLMLSFNVVKVFKTNNPQELEPELKRIALTTFVISLVFFVQVYI